MGESDTADLVARWRNGDQQAADELFHRYVDRLIAIARSQMSSRLNQRLDAEDVVQSAYRCFFSLARAGRYNLEHGGDLWRFLLALTFNKLRQHVNRNRAQKRAAQREANFGSEDSLINLQAEIAARAPSPADAAALTDQLEQALAGLAAHERRVVELRLQGYKLEEIALDLACTERTVRRILDRFKNHLDLLTSV